MKTIEEKNRMIAEFMGYKPANIVVNVAQSDGYTRATNVTAYQIEPKRADDFPNLTADFMLKYHTSWDWLMPVVKKCAEESTTSDQRDRITFALLSMDIEKMYNAVVKFIEWYNENK